MPCRSLGDFCTASHREDQGVYPCHSLWVLRWKKWQGEGFPRYASVALSDITPPMLYVLCLWERDRPLTHNRPQTNNLTLSQDMEFVVNKVALPKVLPEYFTFPLSLLFHQCATHIHSYTVDITSSSRSSIKGYSFTPLPTPPQE